MKKTIFVLESFDGVEIARAEKMADLDTSKGMIRAIQVEEEQEEQEEIIDEEKDDDDLPEWVYTYVSNDEYELPLFVTDTATEMAMKTHTTKNNIHSSISHANSRCGNTRYRRVYIGE